MLLLLTLLVVLSLLLSAIDKLSPYALSYVMGRYAERLCSIQCSHLKKKKKKKKKKRPVLFNPIDLLLSVCMPFFPLDYVIFTIVVCFLCVATVSGISRAGIRLLWIQVN